MTRFDPLALRVGRASRLQLIYGDRTPEPTEDEYANAGRQLGCDIDVIKATQRVEAPRSAWDDIRQRPTILFERHKFSQFTGGRFNAQYPNIANPVPGGYGPYADQYNRLDIAYALDADAALRSASWGLYQNLGSNFSAAGFGNVSLFVTAMCMSVSEHLLAYVAFIKSDSSLWAAPKHYAKDLEQEYDDFKSVSC